MAASQSIWITVKEAAERARVSAWTIYEECRKGTLRHVKVGGRRVIRLTEADVDAWLRRYEAAKE